MRNRQSCLLSDATPYGHLTALTGQSAVDRTRRGENVSLGKIDSARDDKHDRLCETLASEWIVFPLERWNGELVGDRASSFDVRCQAALIPG